MKQDYLMTNKTYDRLKLVVTIFLPVLLVLYISLSNLLNLSNTLTVSAIMAALMMLGGALLKVADKSWNNSEDKYDGVITITGHNPDTGIPDLALNIKVDPNTFSTRDTVRFKSLDQSS